jgi:predicted DNA-binding transcriptional regulator AlpA
MNDRLDEALLPIRLVCRRYAISVRTVDRWLAKGRFPKPVRINALRYWRVSDLERFEAERETGPVRRAPRKHNAA